MSKTWDEGKEVFCSKCGAATITKCQRCGTDISGWRKELTRWLVATDKAPNFCSNCGSPYPWTESRLRAAHDLANEISGISEDERRFLTQSLDELVKDSPQTQVAAVRFKKIMLKAGKQIASGFREILIDIISETAKRVIWP